MRSLSPDLSAHIAEEVTTLATCWRIARRDGVVQGFTTHDRTLVIDAISYQATTGFTPTAIQSSNTLNVDNLDVEGVLNTAMLAPEDLASGRYDFAGIEIFLVNWMDLGHGKLNLRSGWLGEVSMGDGSFTAEVRGLTQHLQATVGSVFSPECRADLGDMRCKVNLAAFTVRGTVTAVTDRQTFSDSARGESNGWFNYGLLTWLTGANAGMTMEVHDQEGPQFTLFQAAPADIVPGDMYEVYAGCDKRLATCQGKFANAVNFRGEPFVPGQDTVLDYPALR